MRIIESLIRGKRSPETCEDAIAATDNFVAVIDGSTSKTPFRLFPDETNGHAAARLVRDYIERIAQSESTCQQFCEGVTRYLGERFGFEFVEDLEVSNYSETSEHNNAPLPPEQRPTCSAVVYSRYRKELWLIGDCQALFDGTLNDNGKPYEATIAHKRAALIREGMSPRDARKAIEPELIQAMREGQNKTYAVIDGSPIYMDGVKVVSITAETRELVLASDGYPFLLSTLEASEHALTEQLRRDPQCIDTFVATKGLVEGNLSFDDRTYVRIGL